MNQRRISVDNPINDIFNLINAANHNGFSALNINHNKFPSYPRCDVTYLDEETHRYNIKVALAGFSKDDITVTVEPYDRPSNYASVKVLKIEAQNPLKEAEAENKYFHKGISGGSASLVLLIHENDKVIKCTHVDGILDITLEREFPENEKVEHVKIT